MAIDIAWATTKRIFIPRADMPIVQSSPEIRELNVNSFRIALKNMEASVDGMPWPDTHRHVTETTLSGTVYARLIEILAPYTVEFEDGQYSVRTVGANHNILDVKINNQVSLAVQNSAGLINSPEIALLRKALTNRLEAAPGNPGTLVLYDDDGTTPIKTWATRDESGGAVAPAPGAPSRRDAAT